MWLVWVFDDGNFWKTKEVVVGCEEDDDSGRYGVMVVGLIFLFLFYLIF